MKERDIKFDRLEELLINLNIDQTAKKPTILIVGKTGVGKSTVINYFLGRKFERGINNICAPAAIPISGGEEPNEENYPCIGQDGTISGTTYAQIYENQKEGYSLELMCNEKPREEDVNENKLYLYLNKHSIKLDHSGVEYVVRSSSEKVRTIRISDTKLGNQLEKVKSILLDTSNKHKTLTDQVLLKTIFSVTSKKGFFPKDDFSYCDCPGFFDNRGPEERVCATISTELVVKSAESIKAIALVIDWTEIIQTKCASLIEDCEVLSALVPNFTSMASSIFFLVNNKYSSPITAEFIAKTANKLKEQIMSGAIGRERTVEQNTKISTVLDVISKSEKNIFLLDIFDNGYSKAEFTKELEKKDSYIDKAAFNFNDYDLARKKFDKFIFDIASKGRELITNFVSFKEIIEANKRMLDNLRDQDSLLKRLSPVLSKKLPTEYLLSLDVKSELIKFLDKSITDINLKHEKILIKKNALIEKNKNNEETLKTINKDDLVIYWHHPVRDERILLGGVLKFKTRETIEYKDIPFEAKNISKSCQNGEFKSEKINEQSGIYEVYYESEGGMNGYADVSISVRKKDRPDNKKLITQLTQEVEKNNKIIKSLEFELNELDKRIQENQLFKKAIEDSGNFNTENGSQEIQKIICELEEIQKKKSFEQIQHTFEEAKQKLNEINAEISQRKNSFQLLKYLDKYLHYKESFALVSRFLEDYEKYHILSQEVETLLLQKNVEFEKLKNKIDEALPEIINRSYQDNQQLETIKVDLEKYLANIRQKDRDYLEYSGYLYLCKALLSLENESVKFTLLNLSLANFKSLSGQMVNSSDVIVRILYGEFRTRNLSKKNFITLLNDYFEDIKKSLEFEGKQDISLQLPLWITVHKIIRYIFHKSDQADSNLLKKLSTLVNVLPTQFLRQKLLLTVYDEKTILNLICEKQLDLAKYIISIFMTFDNSLEVNPSILEELINIGNFEFFKLFLSKIKPYLKIDVNSSLQNGQTFLILAIEREKEDIVKLILDYGADIERKSYFKLKDFSISENKISPLRFAIKNGYLNIVEILIEHTQNINLLESEEGQNLLHAAAQGNNENSRLIFKRIWKNLSKINRQVLIKQKDKNDYTPFHYIILNNDVVLLEWLLQGKDIDKDQMEILVNQPTKGKNNILHIAIENRNSQLVKRIIAIPGFHFWSKNQAKKTPFQLAKTIGSEKDIKVAIKNKFLDRFIERVNKKIRVFFGNTASEYLLDNWLNRLEYIIRYNSEPVVKSFRKNFIYLEESSINIEEISDVIVKTIVETCKKEAVEYLKVIYSKSDYATYDEALVAGMENGLNINQSRMDKKLVDENLSPLSELLRNGIYGLKRKVFLRAFKEALRYLFYTSLAIHEEKVQLSDNGFESATRLFNIFSPVMSHYVGTYSGIGAASSVLFSIASGLCEVIKSIRREEAISRANNIVESFQGTNKGVIDVDKLKGLAEAFYLRFQPQIEKMTASFNTTGKLSISDSDGIVVFANAIVQRIGVHIMKGEDEFVDDSNIRLIRATARIGNNIKNTFKNLFGDPQTIRPNDVVPLLQRCLMASWKQQLIGLNTRIKTDEIRNGAEVTWAAGSVLCHSGICIFDESTNQSEYYHREEFFEKEIGYCFASKEEVEMRDFIPYEKIVVQLPFQEKQENNRCLIM